MKSALVVTALVILCAMPGFAQDSQVDIFGGYSYLHSDPGGLASGNASGWEASVGWNWNKWFAIKGDISGHYCCDQRMHNFMVGPQINFHSGKVNPFLHGLIGVSHGSSDAGFSDDVLAFAFGGGIDVKASDRISIRIAQVDYLGTRYADETQNNVRVSAGLVFHFGKK